MRVILCSFQHWHVTPVSPFVPRTTSPHAPSGPVNFATVFGFLGSLASREKSDGMTSFSFPSKRLTVAPAAPLFPEPPLLLELATDHSLSSGSSSRARLKSALAPLSSPFSFLATARL